MPGTVSLFFKRSLVTVFARALSIFPDKHLPGATLGSRSRLIVLVDGLQVVTFVTFVLVNAVTSEPHWLRYEILLCLVIAELLYVECIC